MILIQVLVPKNDPSPSYFPLVCRRSGDYAAGSGTLSLHHSGKEAGRGNRRSQRPRGGRRKLFQRGRASSPPPRGKKELDFPSVFGSFLVYGLQCDHLCFFKICPDPMGNDRGQFCFQPAGGYRCGYPFLYPVGILASRVGRKKTILIGVAVLALCFFTGALFHTYHPIVNAVFALVGVSWAAINVNSYPMVVEMSRGSSVGKFTGYYYTFSMAAQIITPVFSGALLEHVGYWTLFPYATLFAVLAFVTMLFVRHGDSKPLPAKSRVGSL